MHNFPSAVAAFHLLDFKHPPWLVLSLVLGAALVSRSLMFLVSILRDRKR